MPKIIDIIKEVPETVICWPKSNARNIHHIQDAVFQSFGYIEELDQDEIRKAIDDMKDFDQLSPETLPDRMFSVSGTNQGTCFFVAVWVD